MSDPRLWDGDDWHEATENLTEEQYVEADAAIWQIIDFANTGNWENIVGDGDGTTPN